MSLTEQDRKTLVGLEIEKARKFLKQADKNYKEEEWDIAANRYYYACFHAVQALFVYNGIASHRHSGMLRQFGKYFVQTGVMGKDAGAFLNRMEQLRTKADYNVIFSISSEELQSMVAPAHNLIEHISKLLTCPPTVKESELS